MGVDRIMEREIENLTLRISDYQDEKVRHLEEKRRLEELVNDVRNKNTELEDTNNKLRGVRDNLREDNRMLRESIATQGHSLERLANSLSANLKSGTFAALRQANIDRNREWDPGANITAPFRALELAGEVGEVFEEVINLVKPALVSLMLAASSGKVSGLIKKLERERLGLLGNTTTMKALGKELADTVICADLTAMQFGIDLWLEAQNKFNETSEKYGFATRL